MVCSSLHGPVVSMVKHRTPNARFPVRVGAGPHMRSDIKISSYLEQDRPAIIAGLIDLQETERAISKFCLPGTEIAEKYLNELLKLNAENQGTILVAKIDGKVVGFIACRIDHDESITTTNDINTFGYISDAWTNPEYRKQGVFKELNQAVENYFTKHKEVKFIKLNVLDKNKTAITAYKNSGYESYELTLIKKQKSA